MRVLPRRPDLDLLGDGAHSVIEAVGHDQSLSTAIAVARPGGHVGMVGVPQSGTIPNAATKFSRNLTIAGGVAPTQANMHELLPDIPPVGVAQPAL